MRLCDAMRREKALPNGYNCSLLPAKEETMDLLNRLTQDMKAAMKSGQKDRLGVIRMMLSDVKNIDLMPNKPTAEQVVEAYAKKLRKGAEEYEKLGKPD